jgi:hypothetical protein
MAHGISSADPDDLARFSQRGLELDAALQTRAEALAAAAAELAGAGEPVAGLAAYAESLTDLVLDWIHLDQFASHVAEGFLACAAAADCDGTTALTVTDADLARHTQVGYADRDTAIAQARNLADDLQALLRDSDASADDIDALLTRTDRGRHDPAFAVAFSERIGVEGYVALVGRIRELTLPARGDDEALAAVGVLATILTTALATAPSPGTALATTASPGTCSAPSAAPTAGRPTLADDAAIDPSFVRALVSGYDTGRLQADPQATDLSVLLSMTDPPTTIAVDIANARLSPILYAATLTDTPLDCNDPSWLGHSGVVTNYATMLARNPDAAAHWLVATPHDVPDAGTNMTLVLHQNASRYLDDGRAFARIVEGAVTHEDITTRHNTFDAAITVLAGPDRILDNPYMPDALAHGAASDMAYLDHLTNHDWPDAHLGQAPPDTARALHGLLTDILTDDSAATTVYGALERYTMDQISHAPARGVDWLPGDDTDNRTEELHRIGALQGLVIAAEGNGLQDSAEAYIARQEARAKLVDYAIGLIPGVGELNDIGELADASVGGFANPSGFEPLHAAESVQSWRVTDMAADNTVMLAVIQHPEGAPRIPLGEMSRNQRAAFREWADDHHDSTDLDALSASAYHASSRLHPE